jgi:hypothetical protein
MITFFLGKFLFFMKTVCGEFLIKAKIGKNHGLILNNLVRSHRSFKREGHMLFVRITVTIVRRASCCPANQAHRPVTIETYYKSIRDDQDGIRLDKFLKG